MLSLRGLSAERIRGLSGLLFDLDDTLLDHGALTAGAYQALCALAATDLRLVAVTGRPASWGELVAGMWPIAGAVSENGHLAHARLDGRVVRLDAIDPKVRAERQLRLHALSELLLSEFPQLTPADDVHGRVSDYTFDVGEHQRVAQDVVSSVRRRAEAQGARTTLSSVHLHISFDTDDKASGSVAFLRRRFGVDSTRALATYAYVGDSENDAPCFAAFHTSVGVANLSGAATLGPRYLCQGARGAGFAELAERLIAARRG